MNAPALTDGNREIFVRSGAFVRLSIRQHHIKDELTREFEHLRAFLASAQYFRVHTGLKRCTVTAEISSSEWYARAILLGRPLRGIDPLILSARIGIGDQLVCWLGKVLPVVRYV